MPLPATRCEGDEGRVALRRALLARAVAGCSAVCGGRGAVCGWGHGGHRRGDEADEPRRLAGGWGRHWDLGRERGVGRVRADDRHRRSRGVGTRDGRCNRVLIANRGEIAVRIVKACFDEGVESVLAVSQADHGSLGAQLADQVVVIGPAAAAESYLDVEPGGERRQGDRAATRCTPATGSSPSGRSWPPLARRRASIFIGPSAEAMRRSGDKATARALAKELDVPINEGSDVIETEAEARAVAGEIGYPVLLKAAAGGGGRGMRMVESEDGMAAAFAAGPRRGRGRLRRRPPLPRALRARAPATSRCRCSATPPGNVDPPRHPRLHPAAPLPEADRGGARSGPLATPSATRSRTPPCG